jgi:predicted DNA-binding transcriptional regulator YafY
MEMIGLVRNRPGVTVSELALSLGRSERTIYRWLSELSHDIGVPVRFGGDGYYLVDEPDSRAAFTPEELVALRAALRSTLFGNGSPLREKAQSAWHKIRDSSPYEKLRLACQLSDGYSIQVTAPPGFLQPEVPRTIESAIADHQRLHIVYRSQKSNRIKEYTVDAYALVFRRHGWYLLAYCLEHGKVVQFKLVRMREATRTGATFDPPADFSVENYFRHSWEAWAGEEPVDVRVRFSPNVAVMVAETKRHPSQRIHPQIDGGIIFEATVSGIEEVAIWIMGFGRDAEALDPPELRAYIADHARKMAEIYGAAPAFVTAIARKREPTSPGPVAPTSHKR